MWIRRMLMVATAVLGFALFGGQQAAAASVAVGAAQAGALETQISTALAESDVVQVGRRGRRGGRGWRGGRRWGGRHRGGRRWRGRRWGGRRWRGRRWRRRHGRRWRRRHRRRGRDFYFYGPWFGFGYGGDSCYWNCREFHGPRYCRRFAYRYC